MERIIPYKGDAPYVFISYAHRDKEIVMPIVLKMQEAGFRVWFDEGIDPGTEWDDVIAARIEGCGYFLAFISQNYLASENCKDELNYSRDIDKHRLLVYLEEVMLPGGMAMRMNRIQSVFKYKYKNESDFYEVLYSTDGIYEMCDNAPSKPQGSPNASTASSSDSQKAPPVQSVKSETIAVKQVVKRYLEYLKCFFTVKPTKAQTLRRSLILCIYAAFILLESGYSYSPLAGLFIMLCLPLTVLSYAASRKEKKQGVRVTAHGRYERKGFYNAAHVLLAFFLAYFSSSFLGYSPEAPIFSLFCLLWTVYCTFWAFVPKNKNKISLLGPIAIPGALLHILTVFFSLFMIGVSVS